MTPDDVYQQIVEFAQDPRCDHLMAVGATMALIEELGDEGWTLIDRDQFFGAEPAHDEDAHWSLIQRSIVDGQLVYDRFFEELQKLPSPVAAAVTMAVLYSDVLAEGQEEAAQIMSDSVRDRLKTHMRQM